MSRRLQRNALFALTILLAVCVPGNLEAREVQIEEPPAWPEGSAAYDNMVSLTEFGYRKIDTPANENARNWIANELESMGYEVERQPFTTQLCENCENIVVTINGTLEDDWRVIGAHHDAICYSPPPAVGLTYPTCTSSGAYDDGTGSGALLELARTFSEWNGTPLHTWKLAWWDYEEWQGTGSPESGGMGSLHFVQEQIPEHVNVTYVNLDMFALNWPVPTPLASQLSGCDEEFWTLYMFTSPVDDWSYYEDRGLEVTDEMQSNAEWFQAHLKEINTNLSHPEEWVRVIDDTKGNSDHYNFIMHNHTATWIRGQHQYIHEEGDTCEQTPKHAQTDSVTTVNAMAGGRNNVEAGLQTGLDVVATMVWWDWESSVSESSEGGQETLFAGSGQISVICILPWLIGLLLLVGFISVRRDEFQLGLILEEDAGQQEQIANPSTDGKTLVESYQSRVMTLCVLYIAQGIPWGFITVTFVTFIAGEGVSASMIGTLLLMGTLPWTFKFLWGPVIDRFQYRPMGRRRPWILFAETGMIFTLSLILLVPDPSSSLKTVAGIFLVYNIFTSLQDVSTDALAVDILRPDEFEKVNSYMFSSKIVGGMIGGAGLGTIIGYVGIKGAILLQIPILLLIMLAPLLMTERPGEIRFPWQKSELELWSADDMGGERNFAQILANIRTAFSLRSTRLGIVLSLSISLSYFLVPVLPLLFIQELGWDEPKFNATKGGLLLIVMMFGYIVGGQLAKIFGGKSVIIYSALAGTLLTICWGLTESLWSNSTFLITLWSIHTFIWGMASINIFSLMMKITWPEVGGTQFTAYMAMMNLSAVIGYSLTSVFAERFDYSSLILLSAIFESLIIVCVMFIDPDETRRVLGTTAEKISADAELV